MSKRLFRVPNYTPTPTAPGAALASNTFQALKGGSTIQQLWITDCIVTGLSTQAFVAAMSLARVTTLEGSATTLVMPVRDAWEDPNASALTSMPVAFVASSISGPVRSTAVTDAELDLAINSFGGIFRMELPAGKEWKTFGNTAAGGESVISQSTWGSSLAVVTTTIIYEPF